MSDNIPKDVLINILIRLPIKTLLRCTSVCKSWHSLLTNPSFITTHLNRPSLEKYNNNNVGDLLLVRRVRGYSNDLCYEQYSVHFDNESFGEFAKFEFPFIARANYFFRIIGSCNGLICFTDDQLAIGHDTILWNPSIRKSVTLPRPRVTFGSHGPFMQAFGFGFDPLTNDYKVVRIVYLERKIACPEIDIFSLSTGTWKNISHLGLPYQIGEWAHHQAYLNGAVHWLASDRIGSSGYYHVVVSFDMRYENFGKMKLPDSLTGVVSRHYMRVSVFQESLCVIEYQRLRFGEESWNIWVMEVYGMEKSWTKKLKINIGEGIERLVGFRNNGDFLITTNQEYLCSYNLETEQLIGLGARGSTYGLQRHSFHVDTYTESLVLLGCKFSVCDTVTMEGSRALDEEKDAVKKSKKRKGKKSKKKIGKKSKKRMQFTSFGRLLQQEQRSKRKGKVLMIEWIEMAEL